MLRVRPPSEHLQSLHVAHSLTLCSTNYDRRCLTELGTELLGALAKLRRATTNFIMSVRPSVRMKQRGSHWIDFYDI